MNRNGVQAGGHAATSKNWWAGAALMGCLAVGGSLLATSAVHAEEPQHGGTLNVILDPEPPMLILGINQQSPTQVVAGKIYESLLRYDFDLDPMPSLAREWEISDDGLTYTFHLQEGVTWHDGEPLTSHDVVFTATEFLPETHSRARANFARLESVTAPDDHTVVFELDEAYPAFILAFEVASFPIMPAHIYEGTDFNDNEMNDHPIGTGPFKFERWSRGDYVQLVAFDDYWQEGKPYLDEIYFRLIPDAASRALALETGQVDMSSFNNIEPFDVPRLEGMPHLDVVTEGYEIAAPLSWIEVNHRVEPLDDPRFRQAMMYALDREFIRDNIFMGLGRIPTGPINTVTIEYTDDVHIYEHNPDRAVELMEEMGLERDGNGNFAEVELLPLPYGETFTRLAEYTREALNEVGIRVRMRSTDSAGWAQRVADWEYELTNNFVYQYGHPALGVSRTYVCDNIRQGVLFTNTMGYCNERVDELFEQAAVENDEELRAELYAEVQQILVDELPVLWLLEMEFPTIVNTRVQNHTMSAVGVADTFADVWIRE
ncbi:peptide/nickel transport system substrate-binding protein [Natronocella acetinitrilica]|uniref:Peptide/nickel transport system substrate-binding protein n=1 Tax=Natronocella acetinitrilica TaxID=414046 RepID=A0AAE3KAJ9_9GAMM|nr:ABC transporter substrate-binding protein [Natronocella acetinitrilica]MCP1673506.1 peptide/nickel transport system substrate-binding protein [Natronocella acetinitrilica]